MHARGAVGMSVGRSVASLFDAQTFFRVFSLFSCHPTSSLAAALVWRLRDSASK